jgi:FMN phosphatase YigB (HAD superfamily)
METKQIVILWSLITMAKLLITDLDNTLYDWVSYFSQSFEALVNAIHELTGIEINILLSEFKVIHQKYNSSERPYASLELESIALHFNEVNKDRLKEKLQPAFAKFSKKRKETLFLYPGVKETLKELKERGVVIVGHTESYEVNSVFRAKSLGLEKYLKHLYTIRSDSSSHPDINKPIIGEADLDWVVTLPETERKPNPQLILDICRREGISPSDTYYLGDSIVKDISMANRAGVNSIWAKYGKNIDMVNWSLLVSITHWTNEDVSNEENIKSMYSKEIPKYEISTFSEIKKYF